MSTANTGCINRPWTVVTFDLKQEGVEKTHFVVLMVPLCGIIE